jgi:predicted dehydrogenase
MTTRHGRDHTNEGELRLGIVGSGFAASTIAYAALRSRAVRLAGIWGGSGAHALARDALVSAFRGLDELLAAVDAVAIATPHDTHAELTEIALDRGRHVFCEKPFVTEVEDGRALIRAASARGLVLSVNHFQRFRLPNAAAFTALEPATVQGGVLGGHCRLVETGATKEWQLRPENKGFLLGYGVHAVDLLRWWLRRDVESVRARASAHGNGVERTTSATLCFDDGLEVHLLTSDQGAASSGAAQVGKAVFETILATKDGLLHIDSYGETAFVDGTRRVLATLPSWRNADSPARLDAYVKAIDQFAAAVLDDVPPALAAEDALQAVAICAAISASADSGGRPIAVERASGPERRATRPAREASRPRVALRDSRPRD